MCVAGGPPPTQAQQRGMREAFALFLFNFLHILQGHALKAFNQLTNVSMKKKIKILILNFKFFFPPFTFLFNTSPAFPYPLFTNLPPHISPETQAPAGADANLCPAPCARQWNGDSGKEQLWFLSGFQGCSPGRLRAWQCGHCDAKFAVTRHQQARSLIFCSTQGCTVWIARFFPRNIF